jgi:hypothetical protein
MSGLFIPVVGMFKKAKATATLAGRQSPTQDRGAGAAVLFVFDQGSLYSASSPKEFVLSRLDQHGNKDRRELVVGVMGISGGKMGGRRPGLNSIQGGSRRKIPGEARSAPVCRGVRVRLFAVWVQGRRGRQGVGFWSGLARSAEGFAGTKISAAVART